MPFHASHDPDMVKMGWELVAMVFFGNMNERGDEKIHVGPGIDTPFCQPHLT